MELYLRVRVRVGALHPTPTSPQADWRLVREGVVGNPSEEGRGKQNAIQPYNGGVLSHKKRRSTDTACSMGEPGTQDAPWRKATYPRLSLPGNVQHREPHGVRKQIGGGQGLGARFLLGEQVLGNRSAIRWWCWLCSFVYIAHATELYALRK